MNIQPIWIFWMKAYRWLFYWLWPHIHSKVIVAHGSTMVQVRLRMGGCRAKRSGSPPLFAVGCVQMPCRSQVAPVPSMTPWTMWTTSLTSMPWPRPRGSWCLAPRFSSRTVERGCSCPAPRHHSDRGNLRPCRCDCQLSTRHKSHCSWHKSWSFHAWIRRDPACKNWSPIGSHRSLQRPWSSNPDQLRNKWRVRPSPCLQSLLRGNSWPCKAHPRCYFPRESCRWVCMSVSYPPRDRCINEGAFDHKPWFGRSNWSHWKKPVLMKSVVPWLLHDVTCIFISKTHIGKLFQRW